MVIIPIISDNSGVILGAFEIINFKLVNDTSKAIITSDHLKFAAMLTRFAQSIMDKEKI